MGGKGITTPVLELLPVVCHSRTCCACTIGRYMWTVHFSLLSGVCVDPLTTPPPPSCPTPPDKALDHQLPYQEFTARDPSTEDMRLVVCKQGKRPFVPQTWEECSVSDSQCLHVVCECVHVCMCVHVCARTILT